MAALTRYRAGAMLAEIGVITALYAALTIALQPASYGPLQFRVEGAQLHTTVQLLDTDMLKLYRQ